MFFVLLTAILILGPGYLVWLLTRSSRFESPRSDRELPRIDILVPTYNEAAHIHRKVAELLTLDYPEHLARIVLIDGGSTDGTEKLGVELARYSTRVQVISTAAAGKVRQLNAGLRASDAEWILVTDADTSCPAHTLRALVETVMRDANAGCAGVSVIPATRLSCEQIHWKLMNRLRALESARVSFAHLTGPCYLFHRALLDTFPSGVVADDIHIALSALSKGRAALLAPVSVTELRAPHTLLMLWRHKLRKGQAYLQELLRFRRSAATMLPAGRAVLWWRIGQLTLLPVLSLALFLGLAGCLAAKTHEWTGNSLLWQAAMLLVALAVLCLHRHSRQLLMASFVPLFLSAVLVVGLVRYPLVRQSDCYSRIGA